MKIKMPEIPAATTERWVLLPLLRWNLVKIQVAAPIAARKLIKPGPIA